MEGRMPCASALFATAFYLGRSADAPGIASAATLDNIRDRWLQWQLSTQSRH
jgi:hypothetical protein